MRLIRDGKKGKRGYGGGGRGRVYTYRYHQNDSCIKMGCDESRFNVSLIVKDKVTRLCPQATTFEEKREPKRYQTKVLPLTSLHTALPLSQTGSLILPIKTPQTIFGTRSGREFHLPGHVVHRINYSQPNLNLHALSWTQYAAFVFLWLF